MTGLQFRQGAGVVLLVLAIIWLLNGTPAAPVVAGVRSEPVFIALVAIVLWWVVRGAP